MKSALEHHIEALENRIKDLQDEQRIHVNILDRYGDRLVALETPRLFSNDYPALGEHIKAYIQQAGKDTEKLYRILGILAPWADNVREKIEYLQNPISGKVYFDRPTNMEDHKQFTGEVKTGDPFPPIPIQTSENIPDKKDEVKTEDEPYDFPF